MPTQTKIIMREWNIFKDVHGNLAVTKQAAGSHSILSLALILGKRPPTICEPMGHLGGKIYPFHWILLC